MVTALRTAHRPRARSQVAGLWRVFWLAALLLGVLYTHGASGESAAAHMPHGTPAAAAVATAPAAMDEAPSHRHGDDSAEHAAADCLASQPQQGAELPAPGASLLDSAAGAALLRNPANSPSAKAGSGPTAGRDPAALRV